MSTSTHAAVREADSAYAWWRLVATLGLMTVGSSAMYVVAVVLPAVQAPYIDSGKVRWIFRDFPLDRLSL